MWILHIHTYITLYLHSYFSTAASASASTSTSLYNTATTSLTVIPLSFTVFFTSIFSLSINCASWLAMDSDRGSRQEEHGGGGQQHAQYSTSEIMSSAKVLAEAAQSGFGKEFGSMDKAKVAGAAGDLLGGARQYGKLDDKGMGQYVEKAENYLHQYGGGDGGGGQSEKPSESKPEGHSESGGGGGGGQSEKPSESKPEGHSESGGRGGGGIGDYIKMAQGFMNK